MRLSSEQAVEVFDLLLSHGLHHREADESYRRDFVLRFADFSPMEHWYRDVNSRPVRLFSDTGLEPSIAAYPDYAPNSEEKESFKELNVKIEEVLNRI